jgi:hypothetical protein
VNERQAYALTNPLHDPFDIRALAALRGMRKHSAGFVIQSILAVDR